MSDETFSSVYFAQPTSETVAVQRRPWWLGYGAGLVMVGVAAAIAFVVETLVPTSNLALVFVVPVLLTAVSFGWGAALASAVLAVAAFDFFFVPPLYSLEVASPADIWALVLFVVVAAIASAVADQSRRRAVEAQRAASRAEALHNVAHLVVEAAPASSVIEASATALSRIFAAPTAVLIEVDGSLRQAALAGEATLSDQDVEAAQWALSNHLPTRADAFPFERARFDFWPIGQAGGSGVVLGVGLTASGDDRPADPGRHVELVGAYVAASLSRDPDFGRADKPEPVK
jgi:K+-sensing histidine kinase KdpD